MIHETKTRVTRALGYVTATAGTWLMLGAIHPIHEIRLVGGVLLTLCASACLWYGRVLRRRLEVLRGARNLLDGEGLPNPCDMSLLERHFVHGEGDPRKKPVGILRADETVAVNEAADLQLNADHDLVARYATLPRCGCGEDQWPELVTGGWQCVLCGGRCDPPGRRALEHRDDA